MYSTAAANVYAPIDGFGDPAKFHPPSQVPSALMRKFLPDADLRQTNYKSKLNRRVVWVEVAPVAKGNDLPMESVGQ
jgi:hypothetical protein